MRKNILLLFALLASFTVYAQQMASGYVFEDNNKNGRKDRREAGIPGVAVSNGIEVTVTNDKGHYSLPAGTDNTIFVIKPSGFGIITTISRKAHPVHSGTKVFRQPENFPAQ